MHNTIKAIAFDAVGTLIQAVPSVAAVYQQAAGNVGLEIDTETIRNRFYATFSTDNTHSGHQTNEAMERARWRQIVGFCLPELGSDKADTAFDELWEHFARPESWRLFDDVVHVIETVQKREIKICVASNFDSRLRTVWAGLKGVEPLSDHLVISSEVGVRKPGAMFYKAVAQHLDEPVGNILFVGDDWTNDIEAPREIGFQTLYIDRKGHSSQGSTIRSLDELLQKLV